MLLFIKGSNSSKEKIQGTAKIKNYVFEIFVDFFVFVEPLP